MLLSDLQEHEQIAFVGLVRLVVRADGEFSPSEVSAVTHLAKDVGSAEFWRLMSHAQQHLENADDVLSVVERVERVEVREWIYGVLMGLSAVDGMAEEESQVLDWVMETWQL